MRTLRRSRGRSWLRLSLAGALAALAAAAHPALEPAPAPPPPLLEIEWEPTRPAEGSLFRLRVAPRAVAPGENTENTEGGDGNRAELVALTGEVGRLPLAFHRSGTRHESLAAIPVDAPDTVLAWVRGEFADGRSRSVSVWIPVEPVVYDHERLTVAPRFGSPLSDADRARLDRDIEMAAQVSRDALADPPLWSSGVVMPRNDRITSRFGTGREFNGQVTSRHMGLDLDGEVGDTVVAAAHGVVALVEPFLLAGNVVYLNHGGGLVTGYFHLSAQLVQVGDTVVAGTPIGRVGSTGRVTGPHLHWLVRFGATSVDPLSLVALLPRAGPS